MTTCPTKEQVFEAAKEYFTNADGSISTRKADFHTLLVSIVEQYDESCANQIASDLAKLVLDPTSPPYYRPMEYFKTLSWYPFT